MFSPRSDSALHAGEVRGRRLPSGRVWRGALLAAGLGAMALQVPLALGAGGPELAPLGTCAGDANAVAPAAAQQSAMRCLINFARNAHGLSTLSPSATLARSASGKNGLMLACDDFSHDACGKPWTQVFQQAGYRAPSEGENIAWASAAIGSPRQVMAQWLASPEHRANILRPVWTDQAVSVRVAVDFQGYSGVNLWTSQFGQAMTAEASIGGGR